MAKKTFTAIGFGAIQAGLFLYEAFRSHNFERLVVAEVNPELVASLRRAGTLSRQCCHSQRHRGPGS